MGRSAKEKLLQSAIQHFARQGYRGTTIADIVEDAGANIAAVNYHFGSKDKLFIAALRQTYACAEEAYPISGDVSDQADPMDKIAAFSRAILLRSFDDGPAGDFERIMSNTVNVPNSPVAMILGEVQQLALDEIDSLLHDALGEQPYGVITQAKTTLIAGSTIVCRDHALLGKTLPTEADDIAHFIDRQVTAVIAAITSLKSCASLVS